VSKSGKEEVKKRKERQRTAINGKLVLLSLGGGATTFLLLLEKIPLRLLRRFDILEFGAAKKRVNTKRVKKRNREVEKRTRCPDPPPEYPSAYSHSA
jgi:hypothetical protein